MPKPIEATLATTMSLGLAPVSFAWMVNILVLRCMRDNNVALMVRSCHEAFPGAYVSFPRDSSSDAPEPRDASYCSSGGIVLISRTSALVCWGEQRGR